MIMPLNEQTINVKLVKEVEKYPCLYNYRLEDYSRRDVVDAAWNKIAKSVDDTATNCKERWRNLRTVFVRKIKMPDRTKRPYYLLEPMQFVIPFIKFQKFDDVPNDLLSPDVEFREGDLEHTSHVDDEFDNGESSRDDECNDGIILRNRSDNQRRKRKIEFEFVEYSEPAKKVADGDDPRKLFLLSLLPDIMKLTDNQMRQFRRKVLDALDDVVDIPSCSIQIKTE